MVLSEFGIRHKYAPDVVVARLLMLLYIIALLVAVRCNIGSCVTSVSIASCVTAHEIILVTSTLLFILTHLLPSGVLYLLKTWAGRLI